MVLTYKAKESLQTFKSVGELSVLHRFHFLGIHSNPILTYNMAQVFNLSHPKRTIGVIVGPVIITKYEKHVGGGFPK